MPLPANLLVDKVVGVFKIDQDPSASGFRSLLGYRQTACRGILQQKDSSRWAPPTQSSRGSHETYRGQHDHDGPADVKKPFSWASGGRSRLLALRLPLPIKLILLKAQKAGDFKFPKRRSVLGTAPTGTRT